MFRPCIDLHEGKVKQIVGGSLSQDPSQLRANYVSERAAAWFAELYKRDNLRGGHVILLDPRNEATQAQTRMALRAYPGGLQLGGGVNLENARDWLEAGASHVIVTSWVFRAGKLDWERLRAVVAAIGKNRLVLDLSCRRRDGDYLVMTDRWQKWTEFKVSQSSLSQLAGFCDEFLVHAVDVEGLCRGVDLELVEKLGRWGSIPVTYAGGARSLDDLKAVTRVGLGKVDLTIGSALDIFGGTGVTYDELIAFNRKMAGQG